MSPAAVIYWLVGAAVTVFWALFTITSLREHRPRAAWWSSLAGLAVAGAWLAAGVRAQPAAWLRPAMAALPLLLAALCFLPLGRRQGSMGTPSGERVDERDVIFSREEYRTGSKKYVRYYARRPELQRTDDRIRALPELLAPGGKYYEPARSRYTRAIFEVIEGLLEKVDGPVAAPPSAGKGEDEAGPAALAAATADIKALALHLGAAEVGIARLDPAFVYSHVGRGPEPWGSPIRNEHHFAVVFSLPMDYAHVEAAPRLAITEESAREYLQGAVVSITLAAHIRGLGWPARAHIAGSNYQIMLPPVAVDAGLGELGRFGYLISRRLGARVRLGAVTTDLPLVPDVPVRCGVQEFCEICRRCAENCPSGSIPGGPRSVIRGIAKWPLEVESCLAYWRWLGTDCGICMRVCPFSHPRALVHDLVRAGIARSAFARRIALLGEDLFYGRRLTRESASRPA